MKLRILSALLLAGSIITNTEVLIVYTEAQEELALCTKKSEQLCKFIKKHQYKIAAAASAIIGVGAAVYCYYHGMPKFLERIYSKESKNIDNNQNKNEKNDTIPAEGDQLKPEKSLENPKSSPNATIENKDELRDRFINIKTDEVEKAKIALQDTAQDTWWQRWHNRITKKLENQPENNSSFAQKIKKNHEMKNGEKTVSKNESQAKKEIKSNNKKEDKETDDTALLVLTSL